MSRLHPCVELEYTNASGQKQSVDIDIDMMPLIKKIWAADIHTVASCQELPHDAEIPKTRKTGGYAWIRFATMDDAARFLEVSILDSDVQIQLFGRDLYIQPKGLPYC